MSRKENKKLNLLAVLTMLIISAVFTACLAQNNLILECQFKVDNEYIKTCDKEVQVKLISVGKIIELSKCYGFILDTDVKNDIQIVFNHPDYDPIKINIKSNSINNSSLTCIIDINFNKVRLNKIRELYTIYYDKSINEPNILIHGS
jgi:hypothetical protein